MKMLGQLESFASNRTFINFLWRNINAHRFGYNPISEDERPNR